MDGTTTSPVKIGGVRYAAYTFQTSPGKMVGFALFHADRWRYICSCRHDTRRPVAPVSLINHSDFSSFTVIVQQIANKLYTDFAGPQYWEVYPDVIPTLHLLKQKGLVLGVISNFDERLRPILKSLKIADLFDFTLSSYEVGFCKPDPRLVLYHSQYAARLWYRSSLSSRLFKLALKMAESRADQATHVGDNYVGTCYL